MKTVILQVDPEVPPPTGNPFDLRVHHARTMKARSTEGLVAGGVSTLPLWIVSTGLVVKLPEDLEFRVTSKLDGAFIVSFHDDLSQVLVAFDGQQPGKDFHVFAMAEIVEKKRSKVRFAEKAPEGGRVIRGDAQSVDSVESRSPES